MMLHALEILLFLQKRGLFVNAEVAAGDLTQMVLVGAQVNFVVQHHALVLELFILLKILPLTYLIGALLIA